MNGEVIWKAVGIYGWAETSHKYLTWDLLRSIVGGCSCPVLVFGDFNEIISMNEKVGGSDRQSRCMEAFRSAIDDCSLRDLGCKDMVVLNLPIHNSDHAPILLKKDERGGYGAEVKLRKFESYWLSDEGCEKMVSDTWAEGINCGVPGKLKLVLGRLSRWAKDSFGDVKKRLRETEKRLKEQQSHAPDAVMFEYCNSLAEEINGLRRIQESYWHIRAKANEFRDGDKNTNYFHHKASSRRRRNQIRGLFDANGEWKTEGSDFEAIIVDFFQGLFTSGIIVNVEEATEGIQRVVTEEMNSKLNMEPTNEEIRQALFQMHPLKAPGPDGMHALFFQKFWHIIGLDIIAYIKSWWRGDISLEEVNNTCIALIPKCLDPTCMNEFRPISLCNVIYKIASKTLANKLKMILGSIISINQSAFVPNRLITDNALIGLEIFHAMKRRNMGSEGSIALKLDMSKAYDRVEWDFLNRVMLKMGFDDVWVRRVQSCIESVSFTFKVNGSNVGSVIPSRGLRQGDPVSPYLFLLCADAFSMLLCKAAQERMIHGVRVCKGAPRISHLFFADDSLLFAKASLDECSKVADIISLYERASGQKVNLSKSEVSFSNGVSVEKRWEIIEALGVNEVDRHERYLGLPTVIGRSKKAIFACIKERVWKKIQGWKEKLLSKPGKEILIKAVAQAIPTYMMSIFRIPDGILDDIHAAMAKFWWGNRSEGRSMHWKAWESLCLPKAMGGMGFRDLKCFNQALLAKQVWRLLNDPGSLLYSILKARYFKYGDVLDSYRGFDPSFSWRSIWGSKSLLLEGLKWRVGNGTQIKVWSDLWLAVDDKPVFATRPNNFDPELRVCDIIDFERGVWDVEKVNQIFVENERQLVLNLPLSSRWPKDNLYWWPNADGCYSVKSGYWVGRLGALNWWLNNATEMEKKCWRVVWNLEGPPKLKHFLWRACHGCLAVMERLFYRHISQTKACQLCDCPSETIIHSTLECKYAKDIWANCNFAAVLNEAPKSSFAELMVWMNNRLNSEDFITFATLTWASWSCRNKFLLDNQVPYATDLAQGLTNFVEGWIRYNERTSPSHCNHAAVDMNNTWKRPIDGWVKINVDAHISDKGYVGAGVAIRNHEGVILMAAVRRWRTGWKAELAELLAARFGLMVAVRFGYSNIVLEADSLSMIRKLASGWLGKSPNGLIVDDIMHYSSLFSNCIFSHVKRSGNCLAHLIARELVECGSERIWLDPIPQTFCNVANFDLI